MYGPAQIMAKRAEGFMEHYGVDVRAKNMNLIGSASRFEPLIGDPGDGASPHCAIVDEYHEHDSPRLYDTMITGMGARRQPLIIVITTAGSVSYTHLLPWAWRRTGGGCRKASRFMSRG